MEHQFTEEQANQIIDNATKRMSAGETELDNIISEETQKIINEATAKTLTELNLKFKKELKECFDNIDSTKGLYEKYFNSDRYSTVEKIRQKDLMEIEIKTDINDLERNLNYEIDKFMKKYETDTSTTSSMEYQIQLGNVLKLLEIEPNLSPEYFNFIVEAKDFKLLNLLRKKYNTENLIVLSHLNDKNQIEKVIRRKANTILSYLRQGEKFVPRHVLFELLK